MTPPPPSGTRAPRAGSAPDAPPSRAVLYASILVVVALGAAGAWWFLFGGRASRSDAPPAGGPASGPSAVAGKPYVAASHVDAARSRLSAGPDGNARVELVLRDLGDTAALVAKLRKGADPRSPTLFLDTKTDKTGVGLLAIRFGETGSPGESKLTVELGVPATHVTVIDLRFGGKWEGLELDATASTWK